MSITHVGWYHMVLTQPADRREETAGDLRYGSTLPPEEGKTTPKRDKGIKRPERNGLGVMEAAYGAFSSIRRLHEHHIWYQLKCVMVKIRSVRH